MGEPNIDPNQTVGQYVKPENWNDFINDPDTLIIVTRNQYEVTIGTFKNAINPQSNSFREFPKWVKNEICKDNTYDDETWCYNIGAHTSITTNNI